MHRIDTPTADPDANGVGKAGFRAGAPPGVASTRLDEAWFNALQEEVATTVEGAGLALSKPDKSQLLAAIRKLIVIESTPRIMTQWTPLAPSSLTGALFDVATSPSDLVAVGTGADIRRCDLASLTYSSPTADAGFASSFNAVIWYAAGGVFIAAGNGDEIQTSPTGATWIRRETTGTDWYAAAAGASFAAVVGEAGTIKTTSNGTSFSARTAVNSENILGVAYSPTLDRMVAVGNASGGVSTVQRSNSSGNTWTAASDVSVMAGAHLTQATWSDEAQMFFAGTASPITVWKSPDGLTWSAATGTVTFLEGTGLSNLLALPGHLAVSSLYNTRLYPYSELDGTPTASAVIEVSRLDAGGATTAIFQKMKRIPASSGRAMAGRILGFGNTSGTPPIVVSGYVG